MESNSGTSSEGARDLEQALRASAEADHIEIAASKFEVRRNALLAAGVITASGLYEATKIHGSTPEEIGFGLLTGLVALGALYEHIRYQRLKNKATKKRHY